MPLTASEAAVNKTKRLHKASQHLPEQTIIEKLNDHTHGANLYDLLGVSPDVEPEELKLAYRQKALVEHPDKGGDQETFDAIFYAFKLLQDPEKRLQYDEELLGVVSNSVLVEGKPEHRSTGEGFAHKKTAPRAGSFRQKDRHNLKEEWAGERSGAAVVKTIRHGLTDVDSANAMSQKSEAEVLKEQTEALFKKCNSIPNGSKAKKQWIDALTGKQKQALKALAKVHEAEAAEKAKKWLAK